MKPTLNNQSPSLLQPFDRFHHYYDSVRLPSPNWVYQLPLEMEIPCSAIKPACKSCRLYNGGHIASSSGVRYVLHYILSIMCFCPTSLVISSLLQRFISIHLLLAYLTLTSLFSIRSPQQLYSLCSVEWFGNPACTALPILRKRLALPFLYHLYCSILKNVSIFSLISRHKLSSTKINLLNINVFVRLRGLVSSWQCILQKGALNAIILCSY